GEISATSTDAVNGSQLYSVANDLQTQINNSTPGQINNNIKILTNRVGTVERRVNKVGAGSAALAALHPLDFNPDDKWTIAAGYGHYHNANSAALGAFYRPNEDTMFSVGGTVGTGETQLNAGVSIRLGKRSPESRSRVAMGREIAELNARLQDMENKYNNLLQILTPHAIDSSKTAEFPDVPRNHWAYQYISQLAGNGILVGYPDGTFKGDVKMTRYEFATMLYRALQNGAPIDENMKRALNEFGPELQNIRLNHFRVDRISGDDNDRHKTERVRVNNEPKNERDVYGSRIYNNQ
ncbi:MAG: S-layer homology domain-containing protein, partial [Veillonella sp.]|nr:S-layer homology domain-containing protein [Veillonella sp.]